MTKDSLHEPFMDKALEQAQEAFQLQEVPIGAIVIDSNGKILGQAYNQVELQKTQTAHAELLALKQAAQIQGDWRLKDCILYVTLEPCTMCYAAVLLSRIKLVVFGAKSPVFGYKKDLDFFIKPSYSDINIIGGVKEAQCSELLQLFFKQKRSRYKL